MNVELNDTRDYSLIYRISELMATEARYKEAFLAETEIMEKRGLMDAMGKGAFPEGESYQLWRINKRTTLDLDFEVRVRFMALTLRPIIPVMQIAIQPDPPLVRFAWKLHRWFRKERN